MQIELYNHAKRSNSTKQPSGSGTAVNCVLKNDCSMMNPIFEVSSSYASYNYLKWGTRYYFIDDIIYKTNNIIELQCSIDALATYKTNILNTTAHVLYHTHANTEISDTRLSTKTTKSFSAQVGAFDTLGSVTSSTCGIVISVVGKDSCASYALPQDTARQLLNSVDEWYLQDDVMGPEPDPDHPFQEIVDVLNYAAVNMWRSIKQLIATGKAPDCLKSAIMLPLYYLNIGDSEQNIYLGEYDTQITGRLITNRIFADSATVSIPWQASDWRRNAPYHEIFLHIPYFGLINISPSDVIDDTTITARVTIDLLSGDSTCLVTTNSHVIGQYSANLSAPYAIGSSNINPATAATSIISGAAAVGTAIASGGLTVAAGAAGLFGLANVMNAQPTCIGNNAGGSIVGLSSAITCFTIYHDTTVTPSSVSATIGTPTNATLALSTITGYVQTAAASVSGNMDEAERQTINNMLNSGIYIE